MKTIQVINLGEAVIDEEMYDRVSRYKWFLLSDGRLATYIMDEPFLMSQVFLFPEILDAYAWNDKSSRG